MKSVTNFATLSLISAVTFAAMPAASYADSEGYMNNNVVIYFTRHAEKQTEVMDNGDGTLTEVCGIDKCSEILNPEGELRADLLVEWFERKGITEDLTHAFSSHKTRTRQTIEQIVAAAGLTGDYDKFENDGIQEFPVFASDTSEDFATELSPEGTSASEAPVINALLALEPGSVALVAGHSGTLYDIMYGIGLNDVCTVANIDAGTCDANRYPFDEKKKVANFGDIWKVTLKNGTAKFRYRQNLQPVRLKRVEIAR